MWERAFPLAAYWCRKCGNRFRTTRPSDDEPGDRVVITPEGGTETERRDIDQAVSQLLERIAVPAASRNPSLIPTEKRIDSVLRTVASCDIFCHC
jgi:hypothetical protein